MKTVRWGIIGTGKIANKFAFAVKNAENSELCAVASRTMEKANEFADKHGISLRFSSYDDLMNYEGVDALYIALPHVYHAKYSIEAMRHGKHVLCEKPIAINEKEMNLIVEAQKESGVYIMEAMWTRFLPAIKLVRSVIDEGAIGEVLELRADFCYDHSDTSHQIFDKTRAGGSLLDVGVYGLNLSSIIFGNSVKEIKTCASVNNGVDERTNILLKHENGEIAYITSALTLQKPADAYIYGKRGYIHVPNFYTAESFTVYTSEGAKKYEAKYKGNGFEEEIEECNRCILAKENQSSVMPLDLSAKIVSLMDAVRKEIGVIYPED